jgi:DedD protein
VDIKLKHRLVGACVILALAVFFLPMILDSEKYNKEIESQIPESSVLNESSDNASSNTTASDSGSLTINLDEDEPEKAIIKPPPASQVNDDAEPAANVVDKSEENKDKLVTSASDTQGEGTEDKDTEKSKAKKEPAAATKETVVKQDVDKKEAAEAKPQPNEQQVAKDSKDEDQVNDNSKEVAQTKDKQADKAAPQFQESAWVIQIGSFSNKDNATQLVSDLRTKGFRAYSREAGKYLRVYVGPYPDKEAANSRTESLEEVVGAAVKVIQFDPQTH